MNEPVTYELDEADVQKALIAYLMLYRKVEFKVGDKFRTRVSGNKEQFKMEVDVYSLPKLNP